MENFINDKKHDGDSSLASKLNELDTKAKQYWWSRVERFNQKDIRIILCLIWIFLSFVSLMYCIFIPERFLNLTVSRLNHLYMGIFCFRYLYFKTKMVISSSSSSNIVKQKTHVRDNHHSSCSFSTCKGVDFIHQKEENHDYEIV